MERFTIRKRLELIEKLDLETNYGKNEIPFKKDYMYANAINADFSTVIYRIVKIDMFKQIMTNHQLTFVHPEEWKDPFENFILNSIGILPTGERVSFYEIRDKHYAQCWTTRKECDGLWRNFRGSGIAIKIKSKIGTLFNKFYDITNPFHSLSYFVGRVDYVPQKDIEDIVKEKLRLIGSGGNDLPFILSLLTKRDQFRYEEEIRFIFVRPNREDINVSKISHPWNNGPFFTFHIEPNDLFEEIEFEPWISNNKFEIQKNELIRLGYSGLITKSKIYDKPGFEIEL